MIIEVSGVEVGSKNRSNIDPKMESKMGLLFGIVFFCFCVFGGFWVPSWEAKPSQEGPKRGPDRTRKAKPRPRQGQAKPRPSQDAAATSKQRPGHVLTERRGFPDLKGGDLPRALDPSDREGLLRLITTFWPS